MVPTPPAVNAVVPCGSIAERPAIAAACCCWVCRVCAFCAAAAAAIARLCKNAASVAADTDNDKCDGCKPLLFRAATAAADSPG